MGVRVPPFAPLLLPAFLLQLLAFAVLGGPQLVTGALMNDRLKDFGFFRDTLHSLNVHGEFPWWNPSIWSGFPFYYIEILFWPGREPVFASLAAGSWLLGRAGITIDSYHAIFVVYVAFLVPLVFTLSVLALASQVIRWRPALYVVTALMAFSPSVVFTQTDLGSETTAYGFLCAAAALAFARHPGRRTFALLAAASIAAASALTYFALVWNAFFIPLFGMIAVQEWKRTHTRRRRLPDAVPGWWWIGAAAAIAIVAMPSLLAYATGSDILAVPAQGERAYGYESLRAGTPLEAVAISTPGIGFEWTDYTDPAAAFTRRALSAESGFLSYGYMGLVALPLVVLGLARPHNRWSLRLFTAVGLVAGVVLLSAYSPLFSLVLGLPLPFRAVNHYSDMVVRLGLCPLFAIAAGLGVEALMASRRTRRRFFPVLCAISIAMSMAWLFMLQRGAEGESIVVGLAVLAIAACAGAAWTLARALTPLSIRQAVVVLAGVVVCDTSVFAVTHLRLSSSTVSERPYDPGPEVLGSVWGDAETNFLYLRGLNDPSVVDDERLVVALSHPATGAVLQGRIDPIARTYNRVTLRVDTPEAARLEWRDADFPGWRAFVNGEEVPVERTVAGMKAVVVPAGMSDVLFAFGPEQVRISLVASAITMLLALAAVGATRRLWPAR